MLKFETILKFWYFRFLKAHDYQSVSWIDRVLRTLIGDEQMGFGNSGYASFDKS